MTSPAAVERHHLADALAAAGPDAPTLCTGWTARDLATHLVLREGRPDVVLGFLIPVPALRRRSERIRERYAARPFPALVQRVRSGPPRISAAVPGLDNAVNLSEHFVHGEDVRRAAPGWAPRTLSADVQQGLWKQLASRGRLYFRRSDVGVSVADPGGVRATLIDKRPGVVLHGDAGELTLYATGRTGHAQVRIEGPDEAVERFRALRLRI